MTSIIKQVGVFGIPKAIFLMIHPNDPEYEKFQDMVRNPDRPTLVLKVKDFLYCINQKGEESYDFQMKLSNTLFLGTPNDFLRSNHTRNELVDVQIYQVMIADPREVKYVSDEIDQMRYPKWSAFKIQNQVSQNAVREYLEYVLSIF